VIALPYGVRAARVKLVPDQTYLSELRHMIAHTNRQCWCSIFIIDLSPIRDQNLIVHSLLLDLAATAWRGADVRLLIGGSRTSPVIAELSDMARAWAHRQKIRCRWLTSSPVRGSHVKLVIADDQVMTGSHNWSVGAFSGQVQDSVLINSDGLAAYLGTIFERQWARAEIGGADVPV
jgi:phosphatidylserine/phosphatidylglycerophosphate/cardiolipin synthase-like enzyme